MKAVITRLANDDHDLGDADSVRSPSRRAVDHQPIATVERGKREIGGEPLILSGQDALN